MDAVAGSSWPDECVSVNNDIQRGMYGSIQVNSTKLSRLWNLSSGSMFPVASWCFLLGSDYTLDMPRLSRGPRHPQMR